MLRLFFDCLLGVDSRFVDFLIEDVLMFEGSVAA
jgi:hypothetical protein